MPTVFPWAKALRYYRRKSASFVSRKPIAIQLERPVISFTFDDFPRSAGTVGGAILKRLGAVGTYYVSLGLLGQDSDRGPIVQSRDLLPLIEEGHELGCHTYSHCDSWETGSEAFERSIIENRSALSKLLPGLEFRTFSYPISLPRPTTKSRVSRHFECSRAGGQTMNTGVADLNQLSAYFLEKSRDSLPAVKNVIDRNVQVRGWLIFATHDIDADPSPYGCGPGFFEEVVRYAAASGSRILPVIKALEAIRAA